MTIQVNGEPQDVAPASTIAALLEELRAPQDGVAVAVNAEVVPRGQHGEYVLSEGDQVEVVRAVGGG